MMDSAGKSLSECLTGIDRLFRVHRNNWFIYSRELKTGLSIFQTENISMRTVGILGSMNDSLVPYLANFADNELTYRIVCRRRCCTVSRFFRPGILSPIGGHTVVLCRPIFERTWTNSSVRFNKRSVNPYIEKIVVRNILTIPRTYFVNQRKIQSLSADSSNFLPFMASFVPSSRSSP